MVTTTLREFSLKRVTKGKNLMPNMSGFHAMAFKDWLKVHWSQSKESSWLQWTLDQTLKLQFLFPRSHLTSIFQGWQRLPMCWSRTNLYYGTACHSVAKHLCAAILSVGENNVRSSCNRAFWWRMSTEPLHVAWSSICESVDGILSSKSSTEIMAQHDVQRHHPARCILSGETSLKILRYWLQEKAIC